MTKTIVLISDLHSNLPALERVTSHMPAHDELYCLGDIVGYGPHPNEIVESVQRLKPTLVLLGNHDHAVVTGDTSGFVDAAVAAIEWTRRQITRENMQFLSGLHPSARTRFGSFEFALFHGSPCDPYNEYVFPGTPSAILREMIRLSKADVVLMGHTHVQMYYRDNDDGIILNPGSVGQPRDGDPRAAYAIVEIDNDGGVVHKFRRVQYDIDGTSEAIRENGLPLFLAERLHLGI